MDKNDFVLVGPPTVEVLDRENEYHRIKIVFPMTDKTGKVKFIQGGIINFTPENFPVCSLDADLLTIKFRTGFERTDET